jgi:putative ABC transport system permease protein
VLRAGGEPGALAPAVARAIAALDPNVAVSDARPLTDVLAGNVAEPRFRMTLVGGFAAAALLLAAVGLYGVIAYGVTRRRTEIGIRIALGATPASIRSLFVRRALRLAAVGVAVGAAAAIPAARLLSGLLYGVDARDPATFAVAAGVLVAVAALAALLPARRAAAIQPLDALRPD